MTPLSQIPLAERVRPQRLEEFIGQEHLVGEGKVLEQMLRNHKAHSIIFWGPPGVGKTTLAQIIANALDMPFFTLSAIDSGVKEVRAVIETARKSGHALLFIDEIHRFNKAQQDSLLGAVEKGIITLIGAPLPPLSITTRTGEKHTEKDFKSYKNILVMMFNPTCDHCQEETTILEKNIEHFKDTKLLLVAAPSMIDYLEFYNNVTRYSKYPEITVGVDSAGFIDKTFNYTALPQINIYDKDRKLVKIFSGVVQFDALEPYIK